MREFGWATAAERPQVVSLWQHAFGDSEQLIGAFWDTCFAPERIFVLRQCGKLAAMASIFPVCWRCGQRQTQLWYLYAVATLPECSGAGLATALLEQTAVLAAQRGAEGLLLVPGEPSLRDFYRARGYRDWSSRTERRLSAPADLDPADRTVQIDARAYGALREQLLAGQSHIQLPAAYLEFQQVSAAESGGALLQMQIAGQTACAVVNGTDGICYVPELLAPPELQRRAVAQIAQLYPAQTYRICTPGAGQPFGMLRTWRRDLDQTGYLGLALE